MSAFHSIATDIGCGLCRYHQQKWLLATAHGRIHSVIEFAVVGLPKFVIHDK
jgi:hypothetical protein